MFKGKIYTEGGRKKIEKELTIQQGMAQQQYVTFKIMGIAQ